LLNIVRKFHERFQLFWNRGVVVECCTAPKKSLLESNDVESGNNAKIVVTSFQSREEIRTGLIIGLDDVSIAEYNLRRDQSRALLLSFLGANLEIHHVVANKAIGSRKEGVAALQVSASSLVQSKDQVPFTSQRQTADTNVASTPTWNGTSERAQGVIDLDPLGAGLDRGSCPVWAQLHAVHARHVDVTPTAMFDDPTRRPCPPPRVAN